MIGKTLRNYRITDKLGAGGQGEVYKAIDINLGRPVVIKILPEELTVRAKNLQRFEREARLASSLDHPNICTIYDLDQIDGVHFIAMQLVEGHTVRQLVAGRPLAIKNALQIAIQVADALAAAHGQGIIHRDIKAVNVMVTPAGQVKVLDFGLAKLLDEDGGTATGEKWTDLTELGVPYGTATYAAPEQACGEPVDKRADIFSTGVLLYEMLTGTWPFRGKTVVDVRHAVVHDRPTPIAQMRADPIPPRLQSILDQAMAKNPTDRYQQIEELRDELKGVLQEITTGDSISALRTTASPQPPIRISANPLTRARFRTREILRQRRTLLVLIPFLVLAAAGLGYWLSAVRSDSRQITSIAVLPFENASGNADLEYISDGIAESLINSLTELRQLKVIARSTAFRYRGQEVDPKTVGRSLNVEAVLMGEVRQVADQLNIQVDLVDTRTGTQLWGHAYERKVTDTLAVKQEIASEVTDKLRLRLSGEQQRTLAQHDTKNSEAYQFYMRGRYYWNKRTPENIKKAIAEFQQALNLDPNFALDYAGLADSYIMSKSDAKHSESDLLKAAKGYAQRALQIDDTVAEAHTSLAEIDCLQWQWVEADREFQRAIELNPNYAAAHHWRGLYYADLARYDEALASLKRAKELDPLSSVVGFALANVYFLKGDLAASMELADKLIALDPNYRGGYWSRGVVLMQQRRYQNAITAFQKAVELADGDSETLGMLGYAYALGGQRAEALAVIKQLEESLARQEAGSTEIAMVYVGLGDKDRAFELLKKDLETGRHSALIQIVRAPPFITLRGDPHHMNLLERMGIK